MTGQDRRPFGVFLSLGSWLLLIILNVIFAPSPLVLQVVHQAILITIGLFCVRPELLAYPGPKLIKRGVLYGIGLYALNTALAALTVWLLMRIVDADTIVDLANEERAALEPFLSENGFLSMFTSVLTLVVGAPLSEELFFRGLILDKLRERQSTASALIITALIFAVVHFYLIQFAPVLAAGIVLGVIFIRTENLLVPIIAHAVSNGLALIAWYLL